MLTAKITKLNKRETEVDVSVLFSDGSTLDFTQALSDTIDQDIQDVINHAGNERDPQPEIVASPDVTLKVDDQFDVLTPTAYKEAKSTKAAQLEGAVRQ